MPAADSALYWSEFDSAWHAMAGVLAALAAAAGAALTLTGAAATIQHEDRPCACQLAFAQPLTYRAHPC
ncbi:hypothetical protein RQP53_17440 [Paucibacter sp. APW11]|uniref:Uncharacterized protein n=1 Tax=Roseateles aquae TaxID=3077235 RepID=A0ABU3PGG5_9BURK|nr:hypothetical protein [Paucibacter sp. APW11]MDT9001066.1 hypothetical protein [Paucibacter sp. APW11]